MQRRDKLLILGVIVISAIISSFVAGLLFGSPKKHNATAPVVPDIATSMPDIKNDVNYNSFLNSNAFDPTQPVQTGSSQNKSPFNSSQ